MRDGEYQSNPKLLVLYRELELLNARLIKQRLDDRTRLQRLRSFAQSTLGSHFRIETFGGAESAFESGLQRLPGTAPNPRGGTWQANIRFQGKLYYLGSFPSPEDANAAYRAKHIEFYGTASEYHPDNVDDTDLELIEYAATLGLQRGELTDA